MEAIREVDPEGSISLVAEEAFPSYSRPMISERLSLEADHAKIAYRQGDYWKAQRVDAYLGRRAVKLDFEARAAELDDGSRLGFERLLLATGGRSIVPRMEGVEKRGFFTFTRLSDAEVLSEAVEAARSVVVVGGGLIGVGVAEALVKRGLQVTIVELKERLLSLLLDAEASRIMEDAIRAAGVLIITGRSAQRVLGREGDEATVGGVALDNGAQFSCDLVVVAIGVMPRTELVAGTPVKTRRGILVDRYMETSVPGVYAAGDVAEAFDFIQGDDRVLALWPVAHLQGRIAGYNMASYRREYPGGTAMSALSYFAVPVISVGLTQPEKPEGYEFLVRRGPGPRDYGKLVLRDGRIVGLILVGAIERAGLYFALMKERVDVSGLKERLLSDEFGLASFPEALRGKLMG